MSYTDRKIVFTFPLYFAVYTSPKPPSPSCLSELQRNNTAVILLLVSVKSSVPLILDVSVLMEIKSVVGSIQIEMQCKKIYINN